jgi:thioredoxin 1
MDGTVANPTEWPEQALDLSEDDVEGALRRYELVVVDCWALWCKHSMHMLPIFERLAKEMTGKALFGKVDARQQYHFPVKYRINATPTFLIFRRGELVDRLVGERTKEELEQTVRRHSGLGFLGD